MPRAVETHSALWVTDLLAVLNMIGFNGLIQG